ncbi:Fur family transcriptional regulator [Roseococcus pinisoli]
MHEAADLETTLDRAAEHCAARGAQLTPLRRKVMRLVLEAGQPVGAYALLDRLRDDRGPAAPPTVYRALDFLVEQGLVHKLERLNAFTPCIEAGHDHGEHGHPHQFLICKTCGITTELTDHGVAHALEAAAKRAGFTPERMTVEVEGTCANCAA